jgi:hypothetical protein
MSPEPESRAQILENALEVLDRAEQRACLSAGEARELRRALYVAAPREPGPGAGPVLSPRMTLLLFGLCTGVLYGMVGGMGVGIVLGLAMGDAVYVPLVGLVGAAIGLGFVVIREWGPGARAN